MKKLDHEIELTKLVALITAFMMAINKTTAGEKDPTRLLTIQNICIQEFIKRCLVVIGDLAEEEQSLSKGK